VDIETRMVLSESIRALSDALQDLVVYLKDTGQDRNPVRAALNARRQRVFKGRMAIQDAGFYGDAPIPKRVDNPRQAVVIRTTRNKHGGVGH
jgi:hypothetical protein